MQTFKPETNTHKHTTKPRAGSPSHVRTGAKKKKQQKMGKSTNVQHAKLTHALKKLAPVAADAPCWRKTCLKLEQ